MVLICDNCSLPPEDKEIVSRTIGDIITRRGKGYIAWLKKGKLYVEEEVLVSFFVDHLHLNQIHRQILGKFPEKIKEMPLASVAELFSTNPGQAQSGPLQRNPPDWGHMQQAPTTIEPLMYTYPAVLVTGEPVLLRSILRYGRISFNLPDLQLWDPAFIVPDSINADLIQRYHHTPEIGVRIVQGIDGQLQWSADPNLIGVSKSMCEGIKIAANETLMLKTRIRQGLVSFQENDVDFRYGSFRIPQEIINHLKKKHYATTCGELYIILDKQRNLRIIVKIAGRIDQFLTSVKNL